MSRKITLFLWFNNNAEEAVHFYTSLFNNSKILETTRYGEGAPLPKGTIMTISFQIEGEEFIALNGGPHFAFTPAISLFVRCDSQPEVDRLWQKLLDGGKPMQCGWITDKFGLTWQIVPSVLKSLLHDPDPVKSKRVMQAMLKMIKLDIAELQRAYNNA
jgi:predicted 3-demethylubiquinone-9 3-methyltransferase (glyoxalase superfamily)